jgi:hypothetical protein
LIKSAITGGEQEVSLLISGAITDGYQMVDHLIKGKAKAVYCYWFAAD